MANPNVIEQFSVEIDRLKSIKFLREDAKELIKNKWNTFFVKSMFSLIFNKDFSNLCWFEGWTVTFCAMQVAYYLGFDEVILIGIDHFFKDTGVSNDLVVAKGNDENHFHPEYFGKGIKWQYPDLKRSEDSYLLARKAFEDDDRCVLDATIDGHLQVFKKVSFNDLFSGLNKTKRVKGRGFCRRFIRRIIKFKCIRCFRRLIPSSMKRYIKKRLKY